MNNKISLFLTLLVYFFGCSSVQALDDKNQGSMPVVDYVDLERFMGDWYVIATIPTFFLKKMHSILWRLIKEMMMGLLQRLSLSTKVVSMAQLRYFDLADL